VGDGNHGAADLDDDLQNRAGIKARRAGGTIAFGSHGPDPIRLAGRPADDELSEGQPTVAWDEHGRLEDLGDSRSGRLIGTISGAIQMIPP
jgi:hypothetical protein